MGLWVNAIGWVKSVVGLLRQWFNADFDPLSSSSFRLNFVGSFALPEVSEAAFQPASRQEGDTRGQLSKEPYPILVPYLPSSSGHCNWEETSASPFAASGPGSSTQSCAREIKLILRLDSSTHLHQVCGSSISRGNGEISNCKRAAFGANFCHNIHLHSYTYNFGDRCFFKKFESLERVLWRGCHGNAISC